MLRYSLHTSRRITNTKINLRSLGLTETLSQQQKYQSSDVEFKEKDGRKPLHQKKIRKNSEKHGEQYIDDFANRWSRITNTKGTKNKSNPISRRMQTVNNLKSVSDNYSTNQKQTPTNQKQTRTTPLDNSIVKNRPKTWRDRLVEKSKQREANQEQNQLDPLSSFLRKRNKENDTEKRSGLSRSSEQKKQVAPITDMKDVSALRSAFLKSIKRQSNTPKRQPEEEKPDWRRSGGAKEYRERLKQ